MDHRKRGRFVLLNLRMFHWKVFAHRNHTVWQACLAFLGAKHLSWGNQRVWSIVLLYPLCSEFQPRLQNNILWMLHFNWIFVSKFHPLFLGKYMQNLDLGVNSMVLVGISFQLSARLPNLSQMHVLPCHAKKKQDSYFHIFPLHSAPEGVLMPPFF